MPSTMSFAVVAVLLLMGGLAVTAAPTVTNIAAWTSNQGQTHMTYDAAAQRIYYMDNNARFRYLDTTTDTQTLIRDLSSSGCTTAGLVGAHPSLGITMPQPGTFQFAAFSQRRIYSYVSGPSAPLVIIAGRTDCTVAVPSDNVTATSQGYNPYGMSFDATTDTLYFVSQHTFAGVGMVLSNGNFQIYSGKAGVALYNGQYTDGTFRTEVEYHYVDDVDVSHATGVVMVSAVHGVFAINYATGLLTSVTNTNGPVNSCTGCSASTFSARAQHVVCVIQHPNAQAVFFSLWEGSGSGVYQVDVPYNQVCRRHAVPFASAVVLTDTTTLYAKAAYNQGVKITDLDGCDITWTTSTQDPAVAAFCDDIADKCTALSTECDAIRATGHTALADECDDTVGSCNAMHADCVTKASNCPLV